MLVTCMFGVLDLGSLMIRYFIPGIEWRLLINLDLQSFYINYSKNIIPYGIPHGDYLVCKTALVVVQLYAGNNTDDLSKSKGKYTLLYYKALVLITNWYARSVKKSGGIIISLGKVSILVQWFKSFKNVRL